MKGLMMKDVFTAKKILLVYFLMIVLFSFGGTQTMLFALIYALMLPVNMCSYDERSHFDRMMPALPLTGLQCVLDKYIITYICAAVMMVLSVGATSARCGAWTIPENMLGSLAAGDPCDCHAGDYSLRRGEGAGGLSRRNHHRGSFNRFDFPLGRDEYVDEHPFCRNRDFCFRVGNQYSFHFCFGKDV